MEGQAITECSAVHYVAFNLRSLAAFVIGHNDTSSEVDLVVFTNMTNAAGKKNYGMQFHQDVKYSAEPSPGTWHWPERV